MNHRVLELLKVPKNIQSEDLNLLKEEINSFPYVQNIRALYLYGVHLYDKENYQKVLSATAAYTTDKKILYQLINGKILPKPENRVKPGYKENPLKKLYQSKVADFPVKKEEDLNVDIQNETVDLINQENPNSQKEIILPVPQPEIKHVYVNGERNRILFEGEENFLEDNDVETIDLESTLESGSIVTQKSEKREGNVQIIEEETNHIPSVAEKEELSPSVQDQEIAEDIEEFVPEHSNEEAIPEVQDNKVEKNETVAEESEHVDEIKDSEEFVPETIIEPENINAETGNKEESKLNFHETEIIVPELQNNDTEITEHKTDKPENADETEDAEEFSSETIIEPKNINSETEKILDEPELSFHETESFLSEVKIQNDSVEENNENIKEEQSEDVNEVEKIAEFMPEKIINEDKISSEKEQKTVNDELELSFHGTESFLPEVKIQPNNLDEIKNETTESNINKHEDEIRRLIEEVEKKMKEKAVSAETQKTAETETQSDDISFAETQSFEVKPTEEKIEEGSKDLTSSQPEIVGEPKKETAEPEEVQFSWKPMSFESHVPDSLIDKAVEISQSKIEKETDKPEEIKTDEIASVTEEILPSLEELPVLNKDLSNEFGNQTDGLKIDPEAPVIEETTEEKEEAPVMNVSFFGSDISKLKPAESQKKGDKEEKDKKPENSNQKTTSSHIDSNVPGFINTWQSWLKIDRTEEIEEDKTEIKNKVIETFIENNPRISQLKDESNYVVREKNDDISHLMTETLAVLYFEQKLYTKAIKAFEILIKKNPEKKEYYESKIQEIKDFRSR